MEEQKSAAVDETDTDFSAEMDVASELESQGSYQDIESAQLG